MEAAAAVDAGGGEQIGLDGERVDWTAGDLLLLPIKPGGVEHQHFNVNPGSECRWIAFSYMPFFDHVGSEFTQTELSPLFKAGG